MRGRPQKTPGSKKARLFGITETQVEWLNNYCTQERMSTEQVIAKCISLLSRDTGLPSALQSDLLRYAEHKGVDPKIGNDCYDKDRYKLLLDDAANDLGDTPTESYIARRAMGLTRASKAPYFKTFADLCQQKGVPIPNHIEVDSDEL